MCVKNYGQFIPVRNMTFHSVDVSHSVSFIHKTLFNPSFHKYNDSILRYGSTDPNIINSVAFLSWGVLH